MCSEVSRYDRRMSTGTDVIFDYRQGIPIVFKGEWKGKTYRTGAPESYDAEPSRNDLRGNRLQGRRTGEVLATTKNLYIMEHITTLLWGESVENVT